jgi:type IV secretory pathway VirD2 relaxase
MPARTNEIAVRDAARSFAADMFSGRHDYVFTLHTDTPRPHVHLSICSRSQTGERLNPKKADLELWRQTFAQALRDRGVEAEATPRRARGVTRKAERTPLRKIRDRHEAGQGAMAQVRRSAYQEAAKAAFQGDTKPRDWESRTLQRQARIRQTYLAQAALLQGSPRPEDRALGAKVDAFVRSMPAPDSQRLALARELRAANRKLDQERPVEGRDRSR